MRVVGAAICRITSHTKAFLSLGAGLGIERESAVKGGTRGSGLIIDPIRCYGQNIFLSHMNVDVNLYGAITLPPIYLSS